MPLAAFTGTAALAVTGGYLLIVVLLWLTRRRDAYGRPRPLGCLLGLTLFGLMFVLAFASWAGDHVF